MNRGTTILTGTVISILMAWGGYEVYDMRDGVDYQLRNVEGPMDVVIHHTYTNGKSIEEIEQDQKNRGWPDAAYHFMVNWEGKRYPMNELEEKTWGVAGRNSRAIHIAYVGNGHERYVTLDAILSIQELIAAIKEAGVEVRSVQPHCAYARQSPTSCPGDHGYVQFYPLYENLDKVCP